MLCEFTRQRFFKGLSHNQSFWFAVSRLISSRAASITSSVTPEGIVILKNGGQSMMAVCAILAIAGTAAFVSGCKHTDEHGTHVHRYTCKIHPEVVQNAPGNCPKCGMKLVHAD
jgi:hypothetical protein